MPLIIYSLQNKDGDLRNMQDFLPKSICWVKGKKRRPYSYSYSYQGQILYHGPQVLFDLAIFTHCLPLFLFPPLLSFLKCPWALPPLQARGPSSLCPGPCLIYKPQFQAPDAISPGKPALGKVSLCDPPGQCQTALGSHGKEFAPDCHCLMECASGPSLLRL